MRAGFFLGALLMAAPAAAHQETVAYSRMVIRESGDVEYALKIPVEDLAETAGKSGHTPLNAPEVRAAQELFFEKFQPLVGMTSGGARCPVERAGIEVPEDDRLYGEMRFVFHCPPAHPSRSTIVCSSTSIWGTWACSKSKALAAKLALS